MSGDEEFLSAEEGPAEAQPPESDDSTVSEPRPARYAAFEARIARAREAGRQARRVLLGQQVAVEPTPPIAAPKNRFWAVAHGADHCDHVCICRTLRDAKTHTHEVGLPSYQAVSHAFASIREARAYLTTAVPYLADFPVHTTCHAGQ